MFGPQVDETIDPKGQRTSLSEFVIRSHADRYDVLRVVDGKVTLYGR